MENEFKIKNSNKSRRRFLLDITKWIGGTTLIAASSNLFSSNKIKADSKSVNALNPYLAEIMKVSFNFAPKGWAMCNGQLLPINQNQALFSLLGTTFGGNGQTNFALPNLQGRVAVNPGQGVGLPSVVLGETGGEASHTLTVSELSSHSHLLAVNSGGGNSASPSANYLASDSEGIKHYSNAAGSIGASLANTGGTQPHNNMPAYLGINHVIALQGIFPSSN